MDIYKKWHNVHLFTPLAVPKQQHTWKSKLMFMMLLAKPPVSGTDGYFQHLCTRICPLGSGGISGALKRYLEGDGEMGNDKEELKKKNPQS